VSDDARRAQGTRPAGSGSGSGSRSSGSTPTGKNGRTSAGKPAAGPAGKSTAGKAATGKAGKPGKAAAARAAALRAVAARVAANFEAGATGQSAGSALRARRRPERRRARSGALDTPLEARRQVLPTPQVDPELFGRGSERFARFMGTARFLAYMTAFVGIWLAWNTFAPTNLQFDPRALNYTLMTLILSLQASYAAPLILLAQNRQADRDRVAFEQDRQRSERNLADTEYLAREMAALRIALRDVATRDFVRSELRDLLEELSDARSGDGSDGEGSGRESKSGKSGSKGKVRKPPASRAAPGREPAARTSSSGAPEGSPTSDGAADAAPADVEPDAASERESRP
jgi:uncharacterized membrane protein